MSQIGTCFIIMSMGVGNEPCLFGNNLPHRQSEWELHLGFDGFICRRVISKVNMEMLLTSKRTSKIKGFISKSGKPFDAYLKLEDNGKVVFDFAD